MGALGTLLAGDNSAALLHLQAPAGLAHRPNHALHSSRSHPGDRLGLPEIRPQPRSRSSSDRPAPMRSRSRQLEQLSLHMHSPARNRFARFRSIFPNAAYRLARPAPWPVRLHRIWRVPQSRLQLALAATPTSRWPTARTSAAPSARTHKSAPLQPEPGNIWPGPPAPEPTLADIEAHPTARGPARLPADHRPRRRTRPARPPATQAGARQLHPAGQRPAWPAACHRPRRQPGAHRHPPAAPARSAAPSRCPTAREPTPAAPTGYRQLNTPSGPGAIVVPNGNGTSTVINPNGTVQTIPTPR